MIANFL